MLATFDVAYAGLIEKQNGSPIDPTGRTDLLQIIDAAQADGTLNWRFDEPTKTFPHKLSLQKFDIEVKRFTGEVELQVPLHLIASVCYIHEQQRHVICISIAPKEDKPQIRDLALLLAPSKAVAEEICCNLDKKFQSVYREAVTGNMAKPRGSTGISSGPSQPSPLYPGLLPSGTTATTVRSLISSASSTDDFYTMLQNDLTDLEVQTLLRLTQFYLENKTSLLEYLQKLNELYGPQRRHLLPHTARHVKQEDQAAFMEFLRFIEGTESPSILI